jgi:hypothetical protein
MTIALQAFGLSPKGVKLRPDGSDCSGARFFTVTAKSGDLLTQGLDPGGIAAGHGHSQGKFKLFKLMVVLAAACWKTPSSRRNRRGWNRAP